MATEWTKLTIRLRPETNYLLKKYCKSEPAVIIRTMIERWVSQMVEQENRIKEIRDGGNSTSGREPDSRGG